MKKIVVLIIFLGLLVAAVFVASNQSYINITIDGDTTNSEYTYEITNQSSGKTTTKTSGRSLKTRMPKGDYQVTVRGGEESGLAVVKTIGFFRTTSKTVPLGQELSRQFIGQNPLSCMNYIQSLLISYNCNGRINDIQVHAPGTATSPTYTSKLPTVFDGYIESTFVLGGQTYVLVSLAPGYEDSGPPHGLYKIDPGPKAVFVRSLSELTPGEMYATKPFRDGFIAYSRTSSQAMYYPLAGGSPEKIDLTVDDAELSPVAMYASGSTAIAEYSNDIGDSADSKSKSEKTKTVLVINTDGQKQTYSFKTIFSAFVMCGDQLLCASGEPDSLFVYKLQNGKAKLEYTISGVQSVSEIGGKTIVVRNSDILNLNATNATATIEYSFGEYSYCGIAPANDGYILCVRSDKNTNALLITNKPVGFKIDQATEKLSGSKDAKSVSTYGSYVYVTPELGPLAYNESTQSFGYSAAAKETVGQRLRAESDALGFTENGYQVVYFGL